VSPPQPLQAIVVGSEAYFRRARDRFAGALKSFCGWSLEWGGLALQPAMNGSEQGRDDEISSQAARDLSDSQQ
jgi:hypothetical protein